MSVVGDFTVPADSFALSRALSVCDLVDEVVNQHAAISEARGHKDEWNLRLRFAEEAMVSTFQAHFREPGREFEVRRLNQPTEPRQRVYGLTPERHEALVTAVEEGYFSIPGTISAEELGELLDISANAASQRIRRGTEALVRSGLTITDDSDGEWSTSKHT